MLFALLSVALASTEVLTVIVTRYASNDGQCTGAKSAIDACKLNNDAQNFCGTQGNNCGAIMAAAEAADGSPGSFETCFLYSPKVVSQNDPFVGHDVEITYCEDTTGKNGAVRGYGTKPGTLPGWAIFLIVLGSIVGVVVLGLLTYLVFRAGKKNNGEGTYRAFGGKN